MTYEKAKESLAKLIEVGYSMVYDAVRNMPIEDFNAIPIIDAHTRIVAERYGVVFTVYRDHDFTRYYKLYLISSFLLREEKPVINP